jgi:hypothetical protein
MPIGYGMSGRLKGLIRLSLMIANATFRSIGNADWFGASIDHKPGLNNLCMNESSMPSSSSIVLASDQSLIPTRAINRDLSFNNAQINRKTYIIRINRVT